MRTRKRRLGPSAEEKATRISVSIPQAQHNVLDDIAEQKQVSVAWVVRDAINRYLAERETAKPRQRKSTTR